MKLQGLIKELPVHPHSVAFRTVEAILKGDPVLKTAVKTWKTWQGDPSDKIAATSSDAPFICLTPRPLAAEWFNESRHSQSFLIQIELGGLDALYKNISNFWRAVETMTEFQNKKD